MDRCTKLTNLEDVKQLGIDPDKMIDIGVQCSLEQLLEHGFHADPPRQSISIKRWQIILSRFWNDERSFRDSRSGLIQAVVHLVNKNFDKLSQDFVKLGFYQKKLI